MSVDPSFFEKLVWQPDRMLLNELVFRLEHYRNNRWELGDRCFVFYKIRHLVEQYARFFSHRPDFEAKQIFEIGMWDGGSVVFWSECFHPSKHAAVDLSEREDSAYFREYVASKNLQDRIKTYWGVDQGDAERLREVVSREFSRPLDLVLDDASHMYGPTKASFETLFPLLRPGGLYIIEDWAWGHWEEFQDPEHPWAGETPLTHLVVELVEATGSWQGLSDSPPLIDNVTAYQGFTVVERGEGSPDALDNFHLDSQIRRLQTPADSGQTHWHWLRRWLG